MFVGLLSEFLSMTILLWIDSVNTHACIVACFFLFEFIKKKNIIIYDNVVIFQNILIMETKFPHFYSYYFKENNNNCNTQTQGITFMSVVCLICFSGALVYNVLLGELSH